MAVVCLRGPLRKLAGDRAEHRLEGATVAEALGALARERPQTSGWILDERGRIRRHIHVFVNGERGDEQTPLRPADRVEVIPAITGGQAMIELMVGTKKGLFVLEGQPDRGFEISARAFAGQPVDFALRDPTSGRLLAALTSPFYGPKIFYTDGAADGEWEQAAGIGLPEGGEQALERIWVIARGARAGTLYAGADPGVLFESSDAGASWQINAGLWEQPSRPHWQPGGGGLCLHSICPWPQDPQRMAVAISAAGVWLTQDAGRSWQRGNSGLAPRYLPAEALGDENVALCVHHIERSVAAPERLFMQFHGGVYRSDDAGESWVDIGAGLPSDFGFPLALDPADPDCAYIIPLAADVDRVTPDGRVRVYETRDAGATWTPRGDGLPARDAYLTVLRQAFCHTGGGERLALYFGATSGELFASADAGATWQTIAARLAPVFSLTACERPARRLG